MNKLTVLYQIFASSFAQLPRPTIQIAIFLLTVLMLLGSAHLGYACEPGTSGCGGG